MKNYSTIIERNLFLYPSPIPRSLQLKEASSYADAALNEWLTFPSSSAWTVQMFGTTPIYLI